MMRTIKSFLKTILPSFLKDMVDTRSISSRVACGKHVKVYRPYKMSDVSIGDYSYVSRGSSVSMTTIGKFCSIGPNFLCGWGIHPLQGISTAPMFYSTGCPNGMTLSKRNKCIERKRIIIGNDVFIGANVTVLDGVKIGDGAVIAAGSVVVHDVEPYAIVGGVPAKLIRMRFDAHIVQSLLKIRWWCFPEDKLSAVEKMYDDVEGFVKRFAECK